MAHYFKNVIRAKGGTEVQRSTRISRALSRFHGGLEGPSSQFVVDLQQVGHGVRKQYPPEPGAYEHDHKSHPPPGRDAAEPALGEQSRAWLLTKRVIDLLISSVMLILATPVLLICAVAIAVTSRGPVFFTQERIGATRVRRGGHRAWRLRTFTMYKFRSMYVGRDDQAHRELTEAIITGDKDTTKTLATTPGLLKLSDDPRITPVGGFIRRFSLDELPQLFNVIKGDMSIVGPRPPLQYEVDHYLPWHMGRFNATPGITGLWQVMGRSQLSFEEMVKLDIHYARQQSFLLDMRIILKTFGVVLTGKGAA